jgi:hypothetical protein
MQPNKTSPEHPLYIPVLCNAVNQWSCMRHTCAPGRCSTIEVHSKMDQTEDTTVWGCTVTGPNCNGVSEATNEGKQPPHRDQHFKGHITHEPQELLNCSMYMHPT